MREQPADLVAFSAGSFSPERKDRDMDRDTLGSTWPEKLMV